MINPLKIKTANPIRLIMISFKFRNLIHNLRMRTWRPHGLYVLTMWSHNICLIFYNLFNLSLGLIIFIKNIGFDLLIRLFLIISGGVVNNNHILRI